MYTDHSVTQSINQSDSMAAVISFEPTLSVNLAPQTLRHELDFLRTVSESAQLSDHDVINNAIRR